MSCAKVGEPVFLLEAMTQVLELAHQILELLAQGSRDGCARAL